MIARLSMLGRLADAGDFLQIQGVSARFAEAAERSDMNAMKQISEGAFSLEKKYIPLIEDHKESALRLGCESLIMTVGFQKAPLILSILCLRPKKVILLHTNASHCVAVDVERDPDVRNLPLDVVFLTITEHDATQNYRVIRDGALATTGGVTVVDPTGGRKVMVASLALVAFYHRFPMIYVHTLERHGIPVPFMETLRQIENPFDFFGDMELKLVEDQFNCHLYEAASKTCEELLRTIRDPASESRVRKLKELVEIYRDWDAFLHSGAPRQSPSLSERLDTVVSDFRRLGFGRLLPQGVETNIAFLKDLDSGWKDRKNIVDQFRLVDIFVGALRRGAIAVGKYDDAVARLYRCLEMCSSIKLIEMGIGDVSQPDYRQLASRLDKTEEELAGDYQLHKGALAGENPAIRSRPPAYNLALDDQMALLLIAEDDVARIYQSMKRRDPAQADSLMDKRNRSTLAHGTRPITEEDWVSFRAKVEVIIQKTIGRSRFKELLSRAMHGRMSTGCADP